jgi:glutamyl/glutaminyl-tRNA synthetase
MYPQETPSNDEAPVNLFTAANVAEILRERDWLAMEISAEQGAWCARAAALLGPHAVDRAALDELLSLIFHYDAREVLAREESHVILSRYAARDVLRQLALQLLDDAPLTSERFSEIVTLLKNTLDVRGRELFHPLRLAVAGRSGEGDLDRVILLLDEAAKLPFRVAVKSARERILEFCSVLD